MALKLSLLATLLAVCYGAVLDVNVDDQILGIWINGEPLTLPDEPGVNRWNIPVLGMQVPDNYHTIAIHGLNSGYGPGGMLVEDDEGMISSSLWKCSKIFAEQWWDPYFDDSNWDNATEAGMNDGSYGPWPVQPGLSTTLMWIWHNQWFVPRTGGQPINAYCRFGKGPVPHRE